MQGLLSREATYLVTDELAPGGTDTLCLALLVSGDADAVAKVQTHKCITIDGCAKAAPRRTWRWRAVMSARQCRSLPC